MQIVIDANIIMAMLIKPGKPIDVLFLEELEIFAPELLFEELENNKAEILRKSSLSAEEIDTLFSILKGKITIVPNEDFVNHREFAEKICPDPKDITYFALAIHLQCPVWTNEKKLQKQAIVKVYTTHELIRLFGLSL